MNFGGIDTKMSVQQAASFDFLAPLTAVSPSDILVTLLGRPGSDHHNPADMQS